MSIIPASCLSASDLAQLGNNLCPEHPRRRRASRLRGQRRLIAAVNRSLATLGERVGRLQRPLLQSPKPSLATVSVSR